MWCQLKPLLLSHDVGRHFLHQISSRANGIRCEELLNSIGIPFFCECEGLLIVYIICLVESLFSLAYQKSKKKSLFSLVPLFYPIGSVFNCTNPIEPTIFFPLGSSTMSHILFFSLGSHLLILSSILFFLLKCTLESMEIQ